ncbi:unnamed protein product [marine sediment metagenome]|uniref:Uncharacterized protein n=1 Tax=marine sediment metagenome TaxID=412755 RepID=X1SHP3_9ZZZZ
MSMRNPGEKCESGKPGPHHYDCGQPKDGLVHCVCRKCGDEKVCPEAARYVYNVNYHPVKPARNP